MRSTWRGHVLACGAVLLAWVIVAALFIAVPVSVAQSDPPACTDRNTEPRGCLVIENRNVFDGDPLSILGGPSSAEVGSIVTLSLSPGIAKAHANWAKLSGHSPGCFTGDEPCSSMTMSPVPSGGDDAGCGRFDATCDYMVTSGADGVTYSLILVVDILPPCSAVWRFRGYADEAACLEVHPSGFEPVRFNPQDFVWATLPVTVIDEKDPVAAIAHEPDPSRARVINFDGTGSTDADGTIAAHTWTFEKLDGTVVGSESGAMIAFAFPGPGEYVARLTVTDDDGRTGSATAEVTVAASLEVFLEVPDRVPSSEPFDIVLTIRNSSPDLPATELTYGDGTDFPLSLPATLEVAGVPTDPLPTRLEATAEVVLRYQLREVTYARFHQLSATVAANVDGTQVTRKVTKRLGGQSPLTVEIQPLAADGSPHTGAVEMGVTFEDNRFDVEVTITNNSDDEDVTDVVLDERLSIGPISPGDPRKNSSLHDPLPEREIGTIPAGGSTRVQYRLEALLGATSELSLFVTGAHAGQTVSGLGRYELVVVSDVLLEVQMQFDPNRSYESGIEPGTPVRLTGTVRNVSLEDTVGLYLYPIPEGNAGGGFAFGPGATVTPSTPQGWVLAPEELLDFAALVATLPGRGTRARVRYVVRAFVLDEEGNGTELADAQIDFREGDGYSSSFEVSVFERDPLPDVPSNGCIGVWVSAGCGAIAGVQDWAEGTYAFGILAGKSLISLGEYELKLIVYTAELLIDIWNAMYAKDPEALKAIAAEVAGDLWALAKATGQGVKTAAEMSQLIFSAFTKWVEDMGVALFEGDWEKLSFQIAKLTADWATGAAVEAGVGRMALRMLRKVDVPDGTPARQALDAQAADDAASLATRVASEGDRGLKHGDDLLRSNPATNRSYVDDIFGAGVGDIAKLQTIAKQFDILIAFRARGRQAIDLLTSGAALLKPMAVKIKNVNQIDVKYLGYNGATLDNVYFRYPDGLGPEAKAVLDVESFVDRRMTELAADFPELSAGSAAFDEAQQVAVRARLTTRIEEFNAYARDLPAPGEVRQIDVGFNFSGNGSTIDPNQVRLRNIRTREHPVGTGNLLVEMEDVNGVFKPLTGDIDIVAITRPDGSLPAPRARAEIYKSLQFVAGMQHPETLTWLDIGNREKLLRKHFQGGEPLAIVGPDGDVVAGYLTANLGLQDDPNFLAWAGAGGLDADKITPFVLARGPHRALMAPPEQAARWTGPGAEQYLKTIFRANEITDKIGDGLESERPEFTRDGDGLVLRRNGDDVQVWTQSGEWQPLDLNLVAVDSGPYLLPQSLLASDTPAGSTTLDISPQSLGGVEGPWFQPGDRVVLDPGGPNEEYAVVSRLGSLILEQPVQSTHYAGTLVSVVPARPRVPGPTPTTEPTVPTPTPPPTTSNVAPQASAFEVLTGPDTASTTTASTSTGSATAGSETASPNQNSTIALTGTTSAPTLAMAFSLLSAGFYILGASRYRRRNVYPQGNVFY